MDKVIKDYRYPVAPYNRQYTPNPSKTYEAIYTGEKRCPKRGEWFLSGAKVEAYYAMNDISTPYHIATIVPRRP